MHSSVFFITLFKFIFLVLSSQGLITSVHIDAIHDVDSDNELSRFFRGRVRTLGNVNCFRPVASNFKAM